MELGCQRTMVVSELKFHAPYRSYIIYDISSHLIDDPRDFPCFSVSCLSVNIYRISVVRCYIKKIFRFNTNFVEKIKVGPREL